MLIHESVVRDFCRVLKAVGASPKPTTSSPQQVLYDCYMCVGSFMWLSQEAMVEDLGTRQSWGVESS